MCGLFGFVAKRDDSQLNLKILSRIARDTESRGRHAWGMAWVTKTGELKSFKQTGKITDDLGILSMAADAVMLIGHCRYATHGNPADNRNNHPHAMSEGFVVHNGVIGDYGRLLLEFGLQPRTECDSEVLPLLIDKLRGPTVFDRACKAASLAKGQSPFAMMALTRDAMIVGRANRQPLHVGETGQGIYLASLATALPGEPKQLRENEMLHFGAA